MSLLDIDNTINDIQPIFNSAIIKLIKRKKTSLVYWLNWEVESGFYRYNIFSKKLESTLYDYDQRSWFIYQLVGTRTLIICKNFISLPAQHTCNITPLRLHGHLDVISLSMLS